MEISKHLTYEDVTKAPVGIINKPNDKQLAAIIHLAKTVYDPLVEHFKAKPFVHCVFRGEQFNKAIGGAVGSQHMLGEAMDIDFDQVKIPETNKDIFDFIVKNLPFDQIIWEAGSTKKPDWVHVSCVATRPNRKKITRYANINGVMTYIPFDLYKF